MLQRGDLPRRFLKPSDREEGELGRCLIFWAFAISILREIEANPGAVDDQMEEQKLGAAIKAFRESNHLTAAQFAPALNLTEQELLDLEGGLIPASIAALLKIEQDVPAQQQLDSAILGDMDNLRKILAEKNEN
jgi:hypothetical protein